MRIRSVVLLLVGILMLASTHGSAAIGRPLGLGTHSTGSSFYVGGTATADLIGRYTSLNVVVQPYVSPTAYIPEINAGFLELGLPSSIDAGWAFQGGLGYETRMTNIRGLFRAGLFTNMAAVAREPSGITSLSQLAGRRVTSDIPGTLVSYALITADLASVGLTWNDVQRVPVSDQNDGLSALRTGRADVGPSGAPDSPALQEAHQAVGIRPLNFGDLTPEELKRDGIRPEHQAILDEYLPGATLVVAPAGLGILKEDAIVTGYPAWMIANKTLDDDAAYEIVRTVWERYEELQPIHSWLATWSADTMFDSNQPLPYHPGAIRFYKEKGVWTPEAEQRQQELLASIDQ